MVMLETNAAELAARVGQFVEDLADLSGAGPDALDVMEQESARIFRTRADRTWPPLAASTREAKARTHPGSGPLEASGALRRSLTGRGPGSIRSTGADGASFGTQIAYAAYHHEGRGVPRRRVLPSPRDRAFSEQLVATYANEVERLSAGMVEGG